MKTTAVVLLLAAAVWSHGQDPVPAPAPAPAGEPDAKPESSQDPEPVGRPERHRFEGVYELKRRVVDGRTDPRPSSGYLAITSRHLLLNLATPGARPDRPLVHAGVREWREVQGTFRTFIKLDYWSDGGGSIHLEEAGKEEVRRIEAMRGGVRVVQTDRSWLEFERIE